MYVNFKLAIERGYTINQIFCLQLISQNKGEDLSDIIETYVGLDLPFYEERELVTYINAKNKSQSKWELIRISKKGSKLLDDLQSPKVTEEDITVYEWLANEYRNRGKQLGNQKVGKTWLALFRIHSGISKNALVQLCVDYLNDEEAQKWSLQLDYVFFKPPNIHRIMFDLEESKLWKFYLRNKIFYDDLFKQEKYLR